MGRGADRPSSADGAAQSQHPSQQGQESSGGDSLGLGVFTSSPWQATAAPDGEASALGRQQPGSGGSASRTAQRIAIARDTASWYHKTPAPP